MIILGTHLEIELTLTDESLFWFEHDLEALCQ